MHPNYDAVSVEIPVNDPVRMAQFQELMNQGQDLLVEHIKELGQELGLSYGNAASVYYLRTRSRWSKELEQRLILAYKAGHVVETNGGEDERLTELGF